MSMMSVCQNFVFEDDICYKICFKSDVKRYGKINQCVLSLEFRNPQISSQYQTMYISGFSYSDTIRK